MLCTVQQKPVFNSRWFVKRESLRHADAKSTLFFPWNLKWMPFSGTVAMHLQLHTLHAYLISLWFKVYTKGGSELTRAYKCTLLWSHTPGEWLCACKIWQSLVTFGRYLLTTETFLYKIICAWNFGHKDQVVFDDIDCK